MKYFEVCDYLELYVKKKKKRTKTEKKIRFDSKSSSNLSVENNEQKVECNLSTYPTRPEKK